MIKYVQGNMFNYAWSRIVCLPVNTQHIWGRGAALKAKEKFPLWYTRSLKLRLEAGHAYYLRRPQWSGTTPDVILCTTKQEWKYPSEKEWIVGILKDIKSNWRRWKQEHRCDAISLPPLGCGLGGLDVGWFVEQVNDILGEEEELDIWVYIPEELPFARFTPRRKQEEEEKPAEEEEHYSFTQVKIELGR